jgi:hypothetical protein
MFSIMLYSTIAAAKEIPITQEVEITIPLGEFAVVEFPFKVESKNITSFLVDKPIVVASDEDSDIDVNNEILNKSIEPKEADTSLAAPPPTKSKAQSKPQAKPQSKHISVTQNLNGFTFFPKKIGVLKMVVWGYKHPVLLTIRVSKEDGFSSYQFILPHSDSKEVVTTEQGAHEKIVNDIMVHLFNQTLPKGYKSISDDQNFKSNEYGLRLNRQLLGKKYMGEEWIFTNDSQEKAVVHEESFYQKGIYGVSLESDSANQGESIRVFIVRSASEKVQK